MRSLRWCLGEVYGLLMLMWLEDLLLLQHMCWDKEPSQAAEVRVWLLDHLNTVQEDGEATRYR